MHALPNCSATDSSGNTYYVAEWAGPPGATLPEVARHGPYAEEAFLPSTDFFVVKVGPTGSVVNVWALTASIPNTPSATFQFYKPVGIVINGTDAYVGGSYYAFDDPDLTSWENYSYFMCGFTTTATTGTAVSPTYITNVHWSPQGATPYTASAMILGNDGNLYVTGRKTVSGVNYMYTASFDSSTVAGTDMTGGSNTAGTSLATTGSSTVIIGGSDASKYALWVFGGNEKTYAFNSVAGDTVVSVAINSNSQVYATGTYQTLLSGSTYYQNTGTVESTLSSGSLGNIALVGQLTGNPNYADANAPTDYPQFDGGKQVLIDPSSSTGNPIVLCTQGGYLTLQKYYYASGSWTAGYHLQIRPPTVVAGKVTTSWNSRATQMQAIAANNRLYIAGSALKMVSNSASEYSYYMGVEVNMTDTNSTTDGGLVWSGNNGCYTWEPAANTNVVASGMAVYYYNSAYHIGIIGGYMPASTAYLISLS